MSSKITLEKILIYPIKSLPGSSVPQTSVLQSGALKQDRRWAIYDQNNQVINAKKSELLHSINFTLTDNQLWELTWQDEQTELFCPDTELSKVEDWLSHHLEQKVNLLENLEHGFPDDLEAEGPTILSRQSLECISTWFPDISVSELEQRFRANLIIETPVPFWEDQLVGAISETKSFSLGELEFQGLKICQRCIVPSKNPTSGQKTEKFTKIFTSKRQETLPTWAESTRFDHFYRLGINTKISPNFKGGKLKIGDSLTLH